MERYSYLQAMPNSPLTPLTPLNENTQFEFNFGGDGSLDVYIDSVLQEHRVEQQRKKLIQQANQSFQVKLRPPLPRRYSEEFLKIRDVFEGHEHKCQEDHDSSQRTKSQSPGATPKAAVVKIYVDTTPAAAKSKNTLDFDYANTPTNVHTPLKLKNANVAKNVSTKILNSQQQQKQKLQRKKIMQKQNDPRLQMKENRVFIQSSPVAAKPLCSQVAKILQLCGLTMYYGIFQREEIDLLALRLLRLQDLHDLGIKNQNHCAILMKSIHYARQYI